MIIDLIEPVDLKYEEFHRFQIIGPAVLNFIRNRYHLDLSMDDNFLVVNKIDGKVVDEPHLIDDKILIPRACLNGDAEFASFLLRTILTKRAGFSEGTVEFEKELADFSGYLMNYFQIILTNDDARQAMLTCSDAFSKMDDIVGQYYDEHLEEREAEAYARLATIMS